MNERVLAVDTETTGLNPYHRRFPARPFAVSLCWDSGSTRLVRYPVDPMTRHVSVIGDVALDMTLSNPKITKVFFNAPFDLRMFRVRGVPVGGRIDDVLLMMHVFTGGREPKYALKPLAKKYAGYPDDDEKELQAATVAARREARKQGWCIATEEHFGKDYIKADYWMAPPELLKRYAIGDVERTMVLYLLCTEAFQKEPSLKKVYEQERALQPALIAMENRGLRLHPDSTKTLRVFYTKHIAVHRRTVIAEGAKDLNFRSSKQMTTMFYKTRKHPVVGATENGNPSTDARALSILATIHRDRLAKAILEINAASYAVTNFLDAYDRFQVEEKPGTWVLHPNIRQVGTVTGRMSSSDPNLMNVASKETKKHNIEIDYRQREVFGPRDGHVWYLPDYTQIEVWLFALLSKDEKMLAMLMSGRDFHGEVARTVWGNREDFNAAFNGYRKRGKVTFFTKLYGGGVKKVAMVLDITEEEAAQFVEDYDTMLPGVQRYLWDMSDRAAGHGMIENPFGRRYYFEPDFSYRAANYMIQGTAADVFKRAIVRLYRLFLRRWPGVCLLMPVHDELIIEVPMKYHSKRLMREIVTEMQGDSAFLGMPRPFPVGMKIARSRWSDTVGISV